MDFSHENPIDFDIDSIIMNQSRRKIHFMDYSWLIIISTKWMFEKMGKKNKIPEIPHQAPPLASSSASPAGRTVARRVAPDHSAVGGDEPSSGHIRVGKIWQNNCGLKHGIVVGSLFSDNPI